MSQLNHQGKILPQESLPGEDDDAPGIAQPVSEVEIEELLYEEDRPAEERLARLRELRDDLMARETADFSGDDDPQSLLLEVDRAIDRLQRLESDPDMGLPASFDPTEHRETLSPDDDELVALNEEDEESVEEDVLDPDEWDEGDGFPRKGSLH